MPGLFRRPPRPQQRPPRVRPSVTLYLTDTAAAVNPGSEDERLADLARGAGLATGVTDTVLGPTAGVQVTRTAGGTALTWISGGIAAAFTLAGPITVNVWMSESNGLANVGAQVKIERADSAGVVLSTVANSEEATTELAVGTRALVSWSVVPTSTNFAAGERIKITVLGNDGPAIVMAAAFTFDLGFAGVTAAADGDSWVRFADAFEISAAAQTYSRTATDSLTFSDVVTRVTTANRTATDSLTFSDTVARVLTALRAATDSLTHSDTATRTGTFLRSAADSLTHSDTATRIATLLRAATDSLTHSDTATRAVTANRTASDSLTFSDTVTRALTLLRNVTDSLTHSDVATRAGTFLRSASDSLTFSEVAEALRVIVRSAADSLVFSDAATRTGTFLRSAADSLTHSDAATRTGTFLRSVSDSLTFSDTATRIKTVVRSAVDSLTFSDAATRVGTFLRSVGDTLTFVEDAAAQKIGNAATYIGWLISRGGWH